jgi:hypothetical protein
LVTLFGTLEVVAPRFKPCRCGVASRRHHVDAMIRLFAPELEPRTIRAKAIRQSDGWFALGEMRRLVLDVLRGAIRPLRAPELVVAVMGV